MRHADVAMYRAKEAGKGQVRVVHRRHAAERADQAPTREELVAALRAGEFVAHYQPIVHVETGEVVAAEALVRWDHPRHGLLAPAAFVPGRRGDGHDPRDRPRGAGAGVPRGRELDGRPTATRPAPPCT